MKRFFFDDEEDDDEIDEAEDMLPEFVPEILAFPQQESLSQNILNCSIKICESNFFWKFMSIEKKMKILSSVFEKITTIVEKKEKTEE